MIKRSNQYVDTIERGTNYSNRSNSQKESPSWLKQLNFFINNLAPTRLNEFITDNIIDMQLQYKLFHICLNKYGKPNQDWERRLLTQLAAGSRALQLLIHPVLSICFYATREDDSELK